MLREIETLLKLITRLQNTPRRLRTEDAYLAYNETIITLKKIEDGLTQFCDFLRECDGTDKSREDEYTENLSEMLTAILKIFTDRWGRIKDTNNVYFEIYDAFTLVLNEFYQRVAKMIKRVIKEECKLKRTYCEGREELAEQRRECSKKSSILVTYLICLESQGNPPMPYYIVSRNLQNEVLIERNQTHPNFNGERAWTEVDTLYGLTKAQIGLIDQDKEANDERILRSTEKVVDFFELKIKRCFYQIMSSPLEEKDVRAVTRAEYVIFERCGTEWVIHFRNVHEKYQRKKIIEKNNEEENNEEENNDIKQYNIVIQQYIQLLNKLSPADSATIKFDTGSVRDALKQMATLFGSSTHKINIVDYQTKEEQNEAIISAQKRGYLKSGFFDRYRGLSVSHKNSVITFYKERSPILLIATKQQKKGLSFLFDRPEIKVISDFAWYKLERWIAKIDEYKHASNDLNLEQFITITELQEETTFDQKVKRWAARCVIVSKSNNILLIYNSASNRAQKGWHLAIRVVTISDGEATAKIEKEYISDPKAYGLEEHIYETLVKKDAVLPIYKKIVARHNFKQNKESTGSPIDTLWQSVSDYIKENHHQSFQHWLQILIPTIAITDLEQLGQDINLCEYMLSENHQHIFHIERSILNVATKGALFGVNPLIRMNNEELGRLKGYGVKTTISLIAIAKSKYVWQTQTNLSCFYGHVEAFAEGLYSGSAYGGPPRYSGKLHEAGSAAHIALIRFGEFLGTVIAEDKGNNTNHASKLMALCSDSHKYTLRWIWKEASKRGRVCSAILSNRVEGILDVARNERWLRSRPIDLGIGGDLKGGATDEEYKTALGEYITEKTKNEGFWRRYGIYYLNTSSLLVRQAGLEYLLLNEYRNWRWFRGGVGNVSVAEELRRYNSKKGVWRLINNPSTRITIIHRISQKNNKFEYLKSMLQVFRKNKSLRSLFLRGVIGPRCVASCIVMPNSSELQSESEKELIKISEKELIKILGFLAPKYRYDFLSHMDREIINTRITHNESISMLIGLMPVEQQPLVITEIFNFRSLLYNCYLAEKEKKLAEKENEKSLMVLFSEQPQQPQQGILTFIPNGERSRFLAIRLDALREGKNPWYLYSRFSFFITINHRKGIYSSKNIYSTIFMMLIYLPEKSRSVFFKCFFFPLLIDVDVLKNLTVSQDAAGLHRIVQLFNEKGRAEFFEACLPGILKKVAQEERPRFSEAIRATPQQIVRTPYRENLGNIRGNGGSNYSPALLGPPSANTETESDDSESCDDAFTMS